MCQVNVSNFLFSSNLSFLSFPCKFIHNPSASSNNAVICLNPAINCSLSNNFLSFFLLRYLISYFFIMFLIHSKLSTALVVSFSTVPTFLYESIIGIASTIFSTKFSDTFPSVFICSFSSNKYTLSLFHLLLFCTLPFYILLLLLLSLWYFSLSLYVYTS